MRLNKWLLFIPYIIISCRNSSSNDQQYREAILLPGQQLHYPTDLDPKDKYGNGYEQIFTINGTKFKMVGISQGDDVKFDLNVFKNDTWQTNLSLPFFKFGFLLQDDIDMDGSIDLEELKYGGNLVYLFDPANRRFNAEPIRFITDCVRLDTKKPIYGRNEKSSQTWLASIFAIRNNKKYFFCKADIHFDSNKILNAKVYKCTNGDLNSNSVFLREDIINKVRLDFNLNHYMKSLVRDQLTNVQEVNLKF